MVSRISGSVEDVFRKFDTDKSGQIDVAELKDVFFLLHCETDDVRKIIVTVLLKVLIACS